MESKNLEEIINRCIDRMLGGEPLERVLASHGDRAAELRPALESAAALLATPAPAAPVATRARAMQQMLAEVSNPRTAAGVGGVMGMFGSFSKYPLALRGAALVVAMTLVGAAGLGGAAAMGSGPEPVRQFFGFSSSKIEVEFEGVIVSVEGDTLVIAIGADERSVTVASNAEISRGGDTLTLADLAAGDLVEVEGVLQSDNSILATQVHVEDDDDGLATPEPTLGLPVIVPTDDHGDDDDDDLDDDRDDHVDDSGDDGDDHGDDRDCDATPAADDNSDSGPGSCDDDDADDIGDDDGTETPEADDDNGGHDDDDVFEDSQHTPEIDDDDGDDDHDGDDHDETRTPEPDDDEDDDGEDDNSGSGH